VVLPRKPDRFGTKSEMIGEFSRKFSPFEFILIETFADQFVNTESGRDVWQ
jgi:hypothetical protein